MTLYEKLLQLEKEGKKSYWADRITAELLYLFRLSESKDGAYDGDIQRVADDLSEGIKEDGVITDASAHLAESSLAKYREECKKQRLLFVGHAHIDMNWMWGFHETAVLTCDTVRTVLQLMREYPDFKFSQSQASVYRIIEEYAPELLTEIRERIWEGRWEVTASTWVEADKNMSSGEALTRHILETKDYLSKLLDIDPAELNIDFEPDTFGHSLQVPEICSAGGVSYYYHCRGRADTVLYRWQSPSGAELLCYRDPWFYNGEVDSAYLREVPMFCRTYGMNTALRLYGVGDHGGGPTRRDVSRIKEMSNWPLAPEIKFGTMSEFFAAAETVRERLPLRTDEANFIFTGCYTSQSRIKGGNAIGARKLLTADALRSMDSVLNDKTPGAGMKEAWRDYLFNQFHDILPGSGVAETREYAMGKYQQVYAAADTAAGAAMTDICAEIGVDALRVLPDEAYDTSEGAGVGLVPLAERGRGSVRAYALFNTTTFEKKQPAELTLWDWQEKPENIRVLKADGSSCPSVVTEVGNGIWGHRFVKLLVQTAVPPMGWTVCTVHSAPPAPPTFDALFKEEDQRVDRMSDGDITVENDLVSAEFDRETMTINRFGPKGGKSVTAPDAGSFVYISEDTVNGMTAWRVGLRKKTVNLNREGEVTLKKRSVTELQTKLVYEIRYQGIWLSVTVTLDAGSGALRYAVVCDGLPAGTGDTVPALAFRVPYAFGSDKCVCAVPMGTVERSPAQSDVPCTGWLFPKNSGDASDKTLLVMSDTKYGFRYTGRDVWVSCIRCSTEPDPLPESGRHTFGLSINVTEQSAYAASEAYAAFVNPAIAAPVGLHDGALPMQASFVKAEGCVITALKPGEDGNSVVLRLVNLKHTPARALLTCMQAPLQAERTDCCENRIAELAVSGNSCAVDLKPCGVETVKLIFKEHS